MAVLSSDPLMIDGIADTSAKYATAMANGSLNIVFNGVWSRQTDYFTAPNGMISVYGCGTAEGVQKFKISLWKKVDGGAEYVDNTTFYFVTDGQNYHCDIGNLDPNASYRLTISYDSSKYYLYGLLKVEGIADEYPNQTFSDADALRLYLGHGFVAQSAGSGMGAYSFLAGRSWLAVIVLLPTVRASTPCTASRAFPSAGPPPTPSAKRF